MGKVKGARMGSGKGKGEGERGRWEGKRANIRAI